jgi:hypothetical protein
VRNFLNKQKNQFKQFKKNNKVTQEYIIPLKGKAESRNISSDPTQNNQAFLEFNISDQNISSSSITRSSNLKT